MMIYIVDGNKYILHENDAIFIKPGSIRERVANSTPAKYVSYNFTAGDGTKLPDKVYLNNIISHEIKTIFSVFSSAHLSNIYSTEQKAKNLLNYILHEICDILDFESNNKHIIRIIKYINEHIYEPITLSCVSKAINLSREYTSDIFRKETGKTVTHYINERKMLIAKELMQSTSYSLLYISERLGYESYSYFSRVYKSIFGASPKKARGNE
jgi:AraC-like DNA-binding protein